MALLDELARLGWSVPPPPARPASAIDWYTPDPETGERFTVRPWRAVHDVDPPGRYTRHATWTSASRADALRALAMAFRSHDVFVSSPVPELAALVTGVAADGAADDRAPAPAPPRGADSNRGPAIVSFEAPADRRDGIEGCLRDAGVVYRTGTEVRSRKQVFRGSVSEHEVVVLVGEAVVRGDQAGELRQRLGDVQAVAEVRVASTEDLKRLDPARRRASPAPPPTGTRPFGAGPGEAVAAAAAPAGPVAASGQAVVHVALDRGAGAVVDRIVGNPVLAGLAVTVSPTTRVVTSVFRGSTTEAQQPCLDVAVSCPPERIDVVRAALAHETGLPDARIVVLLPDGP
jgi:hypothetical protein